MLLAGVGLAWGAGSLVEDVGYAVIANRYMREENQWARLQHLAGSLNDYVLQNEVCATDAEALSAWCSEVGYVYLSVYRDGSQLLGTDGEYVTQGAMDGYTDDQLLNAAQRAAASNTVTDMTGADGAGAEGAGSATDSDMPEGADADGAGDMTDGADTEGAGDMSDGAADMTDGADADSVGAAGAAAVTPAGADTPQIYLRTGDGYIPLETVDPALGDVLYSIPFADGSSLVSLTEYSEMRYYTLVSNASLAAAVFMLVGTLLVYSSSLTRRVSTLSRMVTRVADGELEAPITPRGRDELYLLAADVEAMRSALMQRLHSEQQAWQTNSELITAISHDIRNPLTSLLGYADLLAGGQITDPAEQAQYLATCRDKAHQLKELTDELFGYFVVFGAPTLKVNAEQLDLRILLEQLLGEAVFHLQAQGQPVDYTPLPDDCAVTATLDVMLLKRVFDNVFSNLQKYADHTRPVTVAVRCAGGAVDIALTNAIPAVRRRTESNCIGLRSCARIAQALGLGFSYGVQDAAGSRYAVQLSIPAKIETA